MNKRTVILLLSAVAIVIALSAVVISRGVDRQAPLGDKAPGSSGFDEIAESSTAASTMSADITAEDSTGDTVVYPTFEVEVGVTQKDFGEDEPTGTTTQTQPGNSSGEQTEDTTAATEGTEGAGDDQPMTYERFNNLSKQEQQAFADTFSDMEAFIEWYNAAQKEAEEEEDKIIVTGPGPVTLPVP